MGLEKKSSDFGLEPQELAFVQGKFTAENHLAFAVMLKFFQWEGDYPRQGEVIPKTMISTLSEQLGCEAIGLDQYNWEGRTAKRFRKEIRIFLNYKEPTARDAEQLIQWLITTVLTKVPTLPQCREYAQQFFKKQCLEPFSKKQIDRHIRTALHRFETQFFSEIFTQLSPETLKAFDNFLASDSGFDESGNETAEESAEEAKQPEVRFNDLKKEIAGVKLKNVAFELKKLRFLKGIGLPIKEFNATPRKLIQKYYLRMMSASPSHITEHATQAKYALMASFFYIRSQVVTDDLADLFLLLVHKTKTLAEAYVQKKILTEVKHVNGKFDILYALAEIAKDHPEGIIQDKIYPRVSKETLQEVVQDLQHKGKWYQKQVNSKMRSLHSHAHRRVLLTLLDAFTFHAEHGQNKLLEAIASIKQYRESPGVYYPDSAVIPTDGIIPRDWQAMVLEAHDPAELLKKEPPVNRFKINRLNYEVAVLETLRAQLRCKSIWIEGGYRYRDPNEDLPKDWVVGRESYYQLLGLPMDPTDFVKSLKEELHSGLKSLNDTLPSNPKVEILKKNGGHIKLKPSEPQIEPSPYLDAVQREINRRWSTIHLIDVLKEADLRISFTQQFHTVSSHEILEKEKLCKRLLLCLFGIGSNTGLKRISIANTDANYSDLRYVKRRYLHEAGVKAAIVEVVNEILTIRDPKIWGEATTGCACDSTQVNSWDQNLMSEWHPRYKQRGVMIYWHVDKKATCIHSQIKTCLSSEVGAMISGVLKHDTKMNMNKTYVDTHGQSTIGFAFSHCLKFELLPRLKGIHRQKLSYSAAQKNCYPNLDPILKEPINWEIIEKNYDEVVKHAAALKAGTVEPDVLIKKFTKDNYTHPVYKALTEMGRVAKTLFLCRYLASEDLRIEIHEALNVVERLNSVMGFIFYGKLGEISTNKSEDQSLAVACLHLLQVCMVYINTLIIQEVLSDPAWYNKLTPEDRRALSPLIYAHINPYGLFPLDLDLRLEIKGPRAKAA